MPIQKLQFERAIRLPSTANGVEIPNPANLMTSGLPTSTSASKLICSTETFITKGVKPGDIVYQVLTPTSPLSATVISVDSETQLSLSANIFTLTTQNFNVYQSSGNQGVTQSCVLFVGASGILIVETEGGETVIFNSVSGVLQVRVKKVINSLGGITTTATSITALF